MYRSAIKAFTALLFVLIFALAGTMPASALRECGFDPRWGRTMCNVGITTARFDPISLPETQRSQNWCWAASIAMVFRYHGLNVTQEEIVRHAFGRIEDWPGDGRVIARALSRVWSDGSGRRFQVNARVFDAYLGRAELDNLAILDALADEQPLIYGAIGHATVLTAARYHQSSAGPVVVEAVVHDPYPGRGRRPLDAQELTRPTFIATVQVRPLPTDIGQPDRERAGAGSFCADLQRVITAAPDNFLAVRGGLSRGDVTGRLHDATVRISGADFCGVRRFPEGPAEFSCNNTTLDSATSAAAHFEGWLFAARRCLSGWAERENPVSGNLRSRRATFTNSDSSVEVRISSSTVDGQIINQLRVGWIR
jgi:hypothetical protein